MATPPETIRLDFRPERDGFSFSNHFLWHEGDLRFLAERLRPVLGLGGGLMTAFGTRPFVGRWASGALGMGVVVAAASGTLDRLVARVARRWPSFGLCGGMALAAAEWWELPGELPLRELEKDVARPLIRLRQDRTLRCALHRFLGYWALAQLDPIPARTRTVKKELNWIQKRLRGGHPVVLGLVGDALDPFAMHQVVCYGIERRVDGVSARLSVYDPNSPGEERWIETAPSRESGRVAVTSNIKTGTAEVQDVRHRLSPETDRLRVVFAVA